MKNYFLKILFVFFILECSDASLPVEYQQQIAALVERNPYQLSIQEYLLIAEKLYEKSPCNMLVFGVGNDSFLWMELNRGGNTIFLEDQAVWLQRTQEQFPHLRAYQVSYGTKRFQWKELLSNPSALWMQLPQMIFDTEWDIIFVDAPEGYNETKPGRMKSIYMASYLAHQNSSYSEVFIHDCNRDVEAVYSNYFFHDDHLKTLVDKLRHYEIFSKTSL